jgi:hypothetical protein
MCNPERQLPEVALVDSIVRDDLSEPLLVELVVRRQLRKRLPLRRKRQLDERSWRKESSTEHRPRSVDVIQA